MVLESRDPYKISYPVSSIAFMYSSDVMWCQSEITIAFPFLSACFIAARSFESLEIIENGVGWSGDGLIKLSNHAVLIRPVSFN